MTAKSSLTKILFKAYQAALMVLIYLAMPLVAHAQNEGTGPTGRPAWVGGTNRPPPKEFEAVREIREEQRRLAREAGITIVEHDQRGRSWSYVEDLPEVRDLEVLNEQQVIDAVIPGAYKYFGFTETETLKFRGKIDFYGQPSYGFQEYINGIEVPGYFYVFVDSNKVVGSGGELDIDRGYETEPAMDEQEAFDLTVNFIRQREEEDGGCCRKNDPDNTAAIRSEIVYLHWHTFEGLQPVWQFAVPALDIREPYWDKYIVFPDGTVEGGIRGM